MAIIIKASPYTFTPAYNPVKFIIDSDNKAEKGFRYVVQVYNSGTAVKIFEKRYPPRPGDGYGEVDITKDLSAYVSFGSSTTDTPVMTTITNASLSYKKYDVKFGEEYVEPWLFTSVTAPGVTGPVTLNGSTTPPFSFGSSINVTITAGSFPNLQGLQIVQTVGASSVTINIQDTGSGTIQGYVTWADNRKEPFLGLTASNNNTVWNGALPYNEWITYSPTIYPMGTASPGQFLTDAPDNFRIQPTQDFWLNSYINYPVSGLTIKRRIETSNGGVYQNTSNTFISSSVGVIQCNLSPNSATGLTAISGSFPIIQANTEWIDVYIANASNQPLTEKKRFYIDRRCPIEPYQIAFVDRKGSVMSFSLSLRSQENTNITRESFNKQFPKYPDNGSGPITYPSYDQGTTNYMIDIDTEYTLSTDWLTHEENLYFEQLITSGWTWLKMKDNKYYACVVTDTSFTSQSDTYKKLRKRTVKVKLSVNKPINI